MLVGICLHGINPLAHRKVATPCPEHQPCDRGLDSMHPPLVIYHRADFDGIFCREIARKFMPHATLVGWDYNEPTPEVLPNQPLYILDLSVPDLMGHSQLVWIDHHKSAMERYPDDIRGYRMDGVAACRLAWQWFSGFVNYFGNDIPLKEDFLDRRVKEPLPVQLAGEYDIWDKRNPDAELFQHGLRSEDITPEMWATLLEWPEEHSGRLLVRLLNQGRSLQYARTTENASVIKAAGFTIQWEGLTLLACNHARFNSHLFTAGLTPEHDACLGFCFDGKGKWKVSLYHAPGKEHIDLSQIAVKHGGGGHKGACGFMLATLPFLT